MEVIPVTRQAYELLHEGSLALAQVECNGICVDTDYCHKAMQETNIRTRTLAEELKNSEIGKVWRRTFGTEMNLTSRDQLGKVLFGVMKYPSPKQTENGRYAADGDALATVDHPFIPQYVLYEKLEKAVGTNLKGILREAIDGKVHCFFSLLNAVTYRSSSEAFNFQNVPVRDPELANLIRRAFMARPGRQLVEIDYSGVEVKVAACYHKDPRMLEYLNDESKDMHRDMAMQLFKLPQAEVNKNIRHRAKNKFVFPQFYGDWYIDNARALWVDVDKLKTNSGVLLKDHLASVGITKRGNLVPGQNALPGSFEAHVQAVERDFWNNRFRVYAQWKKSWYNAYLQRGWFQSLTGFVCQGYMGRNDVINYPVQGSAFHCLLWSLIRLVNRELAKRKLKSLIVGQIHDSIVCDVVPGELDEFLVLCRHVMTVLLCREFTWINVPMAIEADVVPVGGSWVDKDEWCIEHGMYAKQCCKKK